jgi:hypothetical protein
VNSTPRTRQEAIDKISSYLSSHHFEKEDEKALRDVLDVLEDAQACFLFFRNVVSKCGIHEMQHYHTNLEDEESEWCMMLSEVFNSMTNRNLY